jgi:hypothetical protein
MPHLTAASTCCFVGGCVASAVAVALLPRTASWPMADRCHERRLLLLLLLLLVVADGCCSVTMGGLQQQGEGATEQVG